MSSREMVSRTPLKDITSNLTESSTTPRHRPILSANKSNTPIASPGPALLLGIKLSATKSLPKDNRENGLNPNKMEENITDVQSPTKGVPHFRELLVSETKRLTSLCQLWDEILQKYLSCDENSGDTLNQAIPNDFIMGEIRTTIGQARLVMKERFQQFEGLVDNCEFQTGEKEINCQDLQGFWEMIYFQVEDVDKKFGLLKQSQSSNWDINVLKPAPAPVRAKKPIKKKILKATSAKSTEAAKARREKLAEKRAEARKRLQAAKLEMKRTKHSSEDKVTFDAGFFKIDSPAKSPRKISLTRSPANSTPLQPERRDCNEPMGSVVKLLSIPAVNENGGTVMEEIKIDEPSFVNITKRLDFVASSSINVPSATMPSENPGLSGDLSKASEDKIQLMETGTCDSKNNVPVSLSKSWLNDPIAQHASSTPLCPMTPPAVYDNDQKEHSPAKTAQNSEVSIEIVRSCTPISTGTSKRTQNTASPATFFSDNAYKDGLRCTHSPAVLLSTSGAVTPANLSEWSCLSLTEECAETASVFSGIGISQELKAPPFVVENMSAHSQCSQHDAEQSSAFEVIEGRPTEREDENVGAAGSVDKDCTSEKTPHCADQGNTNKSIAVEVCLNAEECTTADGTQNKNVSDLPANLRDTPITSSFGCHFGSSCTPEDFVKENVAGLMNSDSGSKIVAMSCPLLQDSPTMFPTVVNSDKSPAVDFNDSDHLDGTNLSILIGEAAKKFTEILNDTPPRDMKDKQFKKLIDAGTNVTPQVKKKEESMNDMLQKVLTVFQKWNDQQLASEANNKTKDEAIQQLQDKVKALENEKAALAKKTAEVFSPENLVKYLYDNAGDLNGLESSYKHRYLSLRSYVVMLQTELKQYEQIEPVLKDKVSRCSAAVEKLKDEKSNLKIWEEKLIAWDLKLKQKEENENEELADAKKMSESLQSQLSDTEKALNEATTETDHLQSSLTETMQALMEKEQRNRFLETELFSMQKDCTDSTEKVISLEASVEEVTGLWTSEKARADGLRAKLERVQEEVEDVFGQYSTRIQESEAMRDLQRQEIEKMTDKDTKTSHECQELRERIETLEYVEDELRSMQEQNTENEQKLECFKQQDAKKDEIINMLSAQVEECKTEIEKLRQSCITLQEDCDIVQTEAHMLIHQSKEEVVYGNAGLDHILKEMDELHQKLQKMLPQADTPAELIEPDNDGQNKAIESDVKKSNDSSETEKLHKNQDSLSWKVDEAAGKLQAIIEACKLINLEFEKEIERLGFETSVLRKQLSSMKDKFSESEKKENKHEQILKSRIEKLCKEINDKSQKLEDNSSTIQCLANKNLQLLEYKTKYEELVEGMKVRSRGQRRSVSSSR